MTMNPRKFTSSLVTINITGIFLLLPVGALASVPTINVQPALTLQSGTTYSITHGTWTGGGSVASLLYACTSPKTAITVPATGPVVDSGCVAANTTQTYGTISSSLTSIDVSQVYVASGGSFPLASATNYTNFYLVSDSGTGGYSVRTATVSLAGGNSDPGSPEESQDDLNIPSPKIPTINQMVSGSLLVTPGTNAVLTGSRLNCTTYVKVNDVTTTFTYSTLRDGSGQLSIAMPASLKVGKHTLAMDSCGGEVVYSNILTVTKAPVELKLDLANASDRALGLIQLRQFMKEHRADFNTITCTADSANSSQQRIAAQVVSRYCHEAFSRLAMPINKATSIKSDHQGRSLILTVSLSNK